MKSISADGRKHTTLFTIYPIEMDKNSFIRKSQLMMNIFSWWTMGRQLFCNWNIQKKEQWQFVFESGRRRVTKLPIGKVWLCMSRVVLKTSTSPWRPDFPIWFSHCSFLRPPGDALSCGTRLLIVWVSQAPLLQMY